VKTLYYFNTADGAGEIELDRPVSQTEQPDEQCDSCVV
jgi:hypothetical protein